MELIGNKSPINLELLNYERGNSGSKKRSRVNELMATDTYGGKHRPATSIENYRHKRDLSQLAPS